MMDNAAQHDDIERYSTADSSDVTTDDRASGPMISHSVIFFQGFAVFVGSAGLVANSFMLIVLANVKKSGQSTTNTLILNQSAMDFTSCVGMVLTYVLKIVAGGWRYDYDVGSYIRCAVFESNMALGCGMAASIAGLITISVERYVKIVHAVAHKKFYRPWMLKACVALPWIAGVVQLVPVMFITTRIIDGKCYPLYAWLHPKLRFGYGLHNVFANLIAPAIAFAYCYGRIAIIIHRRSTVHQAGDGGGTVVSSATAVEKEQQARRRSLNAVRTLALVSAVFIVCALPIEVTYTMMNTGYPIDMQSPLWSTVMGILYVNPLLNPILYAWQYEQVKKTARHLVNRVFGQHGDEEPMTVIDESMTFSSKPKQNSN